MAEGMQPSSDKPVGTTTIAPGVLFTIARLTALSVPGVVALAPVPGVGRVVRRGGNVGVLLDVRDQRVSVEVGRDGAVRQGPGGDAGGKPAGRGTDVVGADPGRA